GGETQRRRSSVTGAVSPAVQRGAIALVRLRDACARRNLSVAGWSILHASGDRIVSVRRDRSQRRHSARLRRTAVARAGRIFRIGRLHLGIDVLARDPVVLAGAARGRRGRGRLFPCSRGRRNPRQRRLLRSDHVWRRGNLVQDRAHYESNRRFRQSYVGAVPAHRTTYTKRLYAYTTPLHVVFVPIHVRHHQTLNIIFDQAPRAIRDNSDRVPYPGSNSFWYKLLAYVMAAKVAAVGGLIYPLLRGFVAPHLFGFEVSTKAVVMSLVGGVATLLAPLACSLIVPFLH